MTAPFDAEPNDQIQDGAPDEVTAPANQPNRRDVMKASALAATMAAAGLPVGAEQAAAATVDGIRWDKGV